jgi:sterol 24-C-methyltransferase
MAFYEHRFATLMDLKPGMKVLDVGCGVGGAAREIAKSIGCEIVGITSARSIVPSR